MSERMTDSLDPYEPQPSYDWDYDEQERRPKVLWGRVLALGAFLILAFLIGRWTAPAGISQEEFDEVKADLAAAQEEIEALEAQTSTEPTTSPSPTETPEETVEGENYTVKSGDTLRGIAEKFYKDASLDDCIMAANDITDATQLSVGATIIIPPEESC
jgi:hypothetical protein